MELYAQQWAKTLKTVILGGIQILRSFCIPFA